MCPVARYIRLYLCVNRYDVETINSLFLLCILVYDVQMCPIFPVYYYQIIFLILARRYMNIFKLANNYSRCLPT